MKKYISIPPTPRSAAYKGRKEAIPPKVKVKKNNKIAGWIAVFSNISNLTVNAFSSSGRASTFLYLTKDEIIIATSTIPEHTKNSWVKLMISTKVKPSTGPRAKAKLPDKPK